MQTITEVFKVYKYSELSEEAKQKAIEENREVEFHHSGEYIETVKKGLEAFDCELENYSIDFDSINRSSWKIGYWREDEALELTGLRLRKYILNNYSGILWERKPYGKYFKSETGWRHQRTSSVFVQETSCPFTGICMDENFLDPFRKYMKDPSDSTTTLKELIEDSVQETFDAACNEWEYIQSDEYTKERLEENDGHQQFLEDGEIYF